MKKCKTCGKDIPYSLRIDGILRVMQNRVNCTAAARYATNYQGMLQEKVLNEYVTEVTSIPPPSSGGSIYVIVVGPLQKKGKDA